MKFLAFLLLEDKEGRNFKTCKILLNILICRDSWKTEIKFWIHLQPVERKKRYEPTLKIPKDLQKMLPFKDTPKVLKAKEDPYKRVAVILEPHEAKVSGIHTSYS